MTALLWNKNYKELISSHGYKENQVTIRGYPEMNKITDLHGHTERILNMKMNPDSTVIVTASVDETLRFWRVSDKVDKVHKQSINKGCLCPMNLR